MSEVVYYGWALLLLASNVIFWIGTLLTLPGNWCILAASALFAAFATGGPGISWTTVGILAALALAGELIEMAAGAAGAAKSGGSRRGLVLSLVGAMVGSLSGAIIGVPIPGIGSAVGAVAGGAMGSFCGAVLGEYWKGQSWDRQMEVGRAAFLGRIAGTFGKLTVGVVMIVIATLDSFL